MVIKFFARFKEQLNCAEETWDCSSPLMVEEVINLLKKRGEPWDKVLHKPTPLVAINHEMASYDDLVFQEDELAIFPPVTGG